MMSQATVDIMLFGNISLMVAATSIGLRGVNALYLRPSQSGFVLSPNGFVFRQPWEKCVCLSLMGLSFLQLPPLMVSSDLSLYHRPTFLAFVGIVLAGAILLWWAGLPRELAVDEDRHTYRWSEGWPPLRRVRTGPLSDLPGVGAMIGGGTAYLVYVVGPGGAGRMIVERFSSAEGAEYYADELAAVLRVPRLAPGACRWPQLSRQKQRVYAEAVNVRPTYRRCERYLLRVSKNLVEQK